MIKKLPFIAFLLFFPLLLTSQNLISITDLGPRDQADVNTEVTQFGVIALNGVLQYKVQYETPDIHGVLDTASGLLLIPDNYASVMAPVLCYQHGTVAGPIDVPSKMAGGYAASLGFASQGYIVSSADYLGLGDARGFHTYIHADSEAWAAIDMMRAVRQYLSEQNISSLDQLFVSGYSQGGHAAAAVQKMMQEDFPSEFEVTASAPMSGPYSVSDIMFNWVMSDNIYFYGAFLPYVVMSYQEAYGNIYTSLSEIFKPEFIPAIQNFRNGNIDLTGLATDIVVKLATTGAIIPNRMFKDSIKNVINTEPNHPLNVALRDNDLVDWLPEAPTRMYYCESDDQVFYLNSIFADSIMNANGAVDLQAESINPALNHTACAPPAIARAVEFFNGFFSTDTNNPFLSDADITVFPNPAFESFDIKINTSEMMNFNLELIDINGKVVYEMSSIPSNQNFNIATDHLPAGLYQIGITENNRKSFKKLVIVH